MFKEIVYNIILAILIPTIFTLAGMGIRYGLVFLKLKLANTKLAVAINWIDKLVTAAEQKFNSNGMGPTKKAFVSTIITNILSVLKIKFSAEEVDALIEASVKELNDTIALIATKAPADTTSAITKETVGASITDGTLPITTNGSIIAGATKSE